MLEVNNEKTKLVKHEWSNSEHFYSSCKSDAPSAKPPYFKNDFKTVPKATLMKGASDEGTQKE